MAFTILGMIEVLAGILIPLIGVILLLVGLLHKKLEKKYRWLLAITGTIIIILTILTLFQTLAF